MFEVASTLMLWVVGPLWVAMCLAEFYASTTMNLRRAERVRRLISERASAIVAKIFAIVGAPYFALSAYHHFREGDRLQAALALFWTCLLSLAALGWLKRKLTDNRGTVGTPT